MENNNEKETFSYSYSAKQQEEINKIREKYVTKEADKMEKLRALDASVTRKGNAAAIAVGVISCLVMGTGMSCCMVGSSAVFIPGIIIGIIGMLGVAAAYPVYSRITEKQRKKIAPEILKLTEEMMK